MEPQARIGIARLTKMAFDGIDLSSVRARLLQRCEEDADVAAAFMDLSVIDQLTGNSARGMQWQEEAMARCRTFRTAREEKASKRLLVYAAPLPMGDNTPIEFLLQRSDFEVLVHYPAKGVDVPAHDIGFCAVPADGAEAAAHYAFVAEVAAGTHRPVVNLPTSLVPVERDMLAAQLAGKAGVHAPAAARLSRADMAKFDPAGFPYVVRPVGSHAGDGLEKLATAEAVTDYLTRQDAEVFIVSEYVAYESPEDGLYRKYRVVFVEGRAYPCHMAIAAQWDVWYLNADMQDCAEKRAEEARFMAEFDTDFGARHAKAFESVVETVGFDYFGIDCAEDRDGRLVVFEADNALIVHDMDPHVIFPYKRAHMERIFTAFERMLMSRCA